MIAQVTCKYHAAVTHRFSPDRIESPAAGTKFLLTMEGTVAATIMIQSFMICHGRLIYSDLQDPRSAAVGAAVALTKEQLNTPTVREVEKPRRNRRRNPVRIKKPYYNRNDTTLVPRKYRVGAAQVPTESRRPRKSVA